MLATGAISSSAIAVAPAPSQGAGPPPDDSPVAAWLAASVGRAIASFAREPAAPGAADAAAETPATAAAPAGFDLATTAMSPLEQAVHDLIGRFSDRDPAHARAAKPGEDSDPIEPADAGFAAGALFGGFAAPLHVTAANDAPVRGATATTAGPAAAFVAPAAPELPSNPSHIHLVLDDGPERVVVTVAVRGSDVHVALRGSDDATTTALARNAASLDHAMRGRGLALSELTTERDPNPQHSPPGHQEPEPRERRKPDAEPFELEEKP
jgi:hypothetical protein